MIDNSQFISDLISRKYGWSPGIVKPMRPIIWVIFQSVCIVIMVGLHIYCICVGVIHSRECPGRPQIPKLLLAVGIIGILDLPSYVFLLIVFNARPVEGENKERRCAYLRCWYCLCRGVVYVGSVGILIYGSLIVYPLERESCLAEVYDCAFWVLTYKWVIFGMTTVCCFCVLPYFCVLCQATFSLSVPPILVVFIPEELRTSTSKNSTSRLSR